MAKIWVPGFSYRTVTTSAQQTKAALSSVLENVTDLLIPVLSGVVYRYECELLLNSTTTMRCAMNGPTMTYFSCMGQVGVTLIHMTAVNTASATGTLTGYTIARMAGIFKPSANGNLQAMFASSANAVTLVTEVGSWLKVQALL